MPHGPSWKTENGNEPLRHQGLQGGVKEDDETTDQGMRPETRDLGNSERNRRSDARRRKDQAQSGKQKLRTALANLQHPTFNAGYPTPNRRGKRSAQRQANGKQQVHGPKADGMATMRKVSFKQAKNARRIIVLYILIQTTNRVKANRKGPGKDAQAQKFQTRIARNKNGRPAKRKYILMERGSTERDAAGSRR